MSKEQLKQMKDDYKVLIATYRGLIRQVKDIRVTKAALRAAIRAMREANKNEN